MNIGFMRKTDYWAGIPLTSLATVWVKLFDFLRPKLRATSAQRVLFIELSEMGSAILADPAMKRVARDRDAHFVIFKKTPRACEFSRPFLKSEYF